MTSEWPDKSFVIECIIISAPKSRGFIDNGVVNVLSTTKKNLNKWVTVKVNVKEHFMKFHNLDLNEINGVAIMSDTDNSKLSSLAYYQNIYFSSN